MGPVYELTWKLKYTFPLLQHYRLLSCCHGNNCVNITLTHIEARPLILFQTSVFERNKKLIISEAELFELHNKHQQDGNSPVNEETGDTKNDER